MIDSNNSVIKTNNEVAELYNISFKSYNNYLNNVKKITENIRFDIIILIYKGRDVSCLRD